MYCGEHNGRETGGTGGRWEGGERPRGEREEDGMETGGHEGNGRETGGRREATRGTGGRR